MSKFKIGDRVVCIDDEEYGITTSEATLTVVCLGKNEIRVRLDGHKSPDHSHRVGYTYLVNPRYFKLAEPKFKGNR